LRKLACLALLAIAAPLSAQAYQCRAPQRIVVPPVERDGPVRRTPIAGYTLALSWSPEYCRNRESQATDAIQCAGANGRFGLVVHGLWPEGRGAWPQWCPTPRKVKPAEVRRNLCMMPFPRVQAHEWAKHGACMTRTPAAYFKTTRVLFEGLRLPDFDRLSREESLSAGRLREAFVLANPAWRPGMIGVHLNQRGWLEELRLCYDRRFMPTRCNARQLGARDRAGVKIWRGL
jgi:ribonuclease T2